MIVMAQISVDHIATLLATALDADDFEAATTLLHPDCEYVIAGQTIAGRDAIIDSYRTASRQGRAKLDRLEFASRVDALDAHRAAITYIDDITHAGHSHRYTCQQIVSVSDGVITHIVHVELPSEREALNAFYTQVGLPVSR